MGEDPRTDDEKQTNFILSCRFDLMKHVSTGDTAIGTARARVFEREKNSRSMVTFGKTMPKPSLVPRPTMT